MFTGIIQAVGKINKITKINNVLENGLCLSISPGELDLSDVTIGDSIAVNGICLTVTTLLEDMFTIDVSQETLHCTHGLDQLDAPVNLEKAMRLSDRLGGHLVSGHVDDTGEVIKFEPVGSSILLVIKAPQSLLKYIASKGSITVNGVSLTVNQTQGNEFSVNLIPHTLAVTTMHTLAPGMRVNLETDMLARYVDRIMNHV